MIRAHRLRAEIRCAVCGELLATGRAGSTVGRLITLVWEPEPVAPHGRGLDRSLYWLCGRCGSPRSIPSGPVEDWTGGEEDPRRVAVHRLTAE